MMGMPAFAKPDLFRVTTANPSVIAVVAKRLSSIGIAFPDLRSRATNSDHCTLG